jgi:hypothetical protein
MSIDTRTSSRKLVQPGAGKEQPPLMEGELESPSAAAVRHNKRESKKSNQQGG